MLQIVSKTLMNTESVATVRSVGIRTSNDTIAVQ